MEFWKRHDLALMETREEMISLIEEYNKTHNQEDKNYYKNLDNFLKRRIGKKVDILTKLSLLKTITGLSSNTQKS